MSSKDAPTTDAGESNSLMGREGDLYMTTYSDGKGKGRNGMDLDSDDDPYHITMPFKKSDELRRQIFEEPEFESDEEFDPGFEETDK